MNYFVASSDDIKLHNKEENLNFFKTYIPEIVTDDLKDINKKIYSESCLMHKFKGTVKELKLSSM